jgi:membrane fusion protein, multidrug efflux system
MTTDSGPPPPPAGVSPQAPRPMTRGRRTFYLLLVLVLVLVGAGIGLWYYLYSLDHESTDDAFIAAHMVQVSPRVPGRVIKLHFTDNQLVKAGDVLAEIDPRDYQVRLDQARAGLESATNQKKTAETNILLTIRVSLASLDQARAGVTQAEWGVEMASAGLDQARATSERAKATADAADADAVRTAADLKRYEQLFAEKRLSSQQMDAATAAARAAAAQLEAARKAYDSAVAGAAFYQAQLSQARGKLDEQNAKLDDARAYPQRFDAVVSQYETASSEVERLKTLVAEAELALSYTQVLAPESGRLARKTVEEGNFLQPGQAMVSLVPENVWIVANFKETAMGRLRPGLKVTIAVDAYPGKVFHGHIDSLQPGSGSVFSLLPPENATGNFVKVVQRVPVKIVFDDPPDPQYWLAPGMSVVPEVTLK